jgi:hypothetical protein
MAAIVTMSHWISVSRRGPEEGKEADKVIST